MEHKPNPLDPGFNVAVLHMASRYHPCGFDVSDDAPDTYEELKAEATERGRITVWSGASDKTVFDDKEVNYAFRAWHDAIHLSRGEDFSFAGEYACYVAHARDLIEVFGDNERTRRWNDILFADIVGQALYREEHGNFPEDQRTFVEEFLRGLH